MSDIYFCSPEAETKTTYGLDGDGIVAMGFQRTGLYESPWNNIRSFLDEQSSSTSGSTNQDMQLLIPDKYSINPSGTAITTIDDDGDLRYYQEDENVALFVYSFPNSTYAEKWARDAGIWWD